MQGNSHMIIIMQGIRQMKWCKMFTSTYYVVDISLMLDRHCRNNTVYKIYTIIIIPAFRKIEELAWPET